MSYREYSSVRSALPCLQWILCAALLAHPAGAVQSSRQVVETPPRRAGAGQSIDPVAREVRIRPRLLPRPVACVGYSQQLTATGGIPPYSFGLEAGSLPEGLTLSPAGLLEGVAADPGVSAFTVNAVDSRGQTGRLEVTLPVTVGYRAPDDEVGLAIPPLGTGGSGVPTEDTTTSSLTVSGVSGSAVLSADVHVSLLHERAGDLILSLTTPDGASIPLATQLGNSGASYLATVFSDLASSSICGGAAPFTGTFRPERPIGMRAPNGTWTLEIEDQTGGNTGRLLSWSVELVTASVGSGETGSQQCLWDSAVPLGLTHQGFTTGGDHLYVSTGNEVKRIHKSIPDDPSNWTRTIIPASPTQPLFMQRFGGGSPVVVVNGHGNGFIYGLDPDDGATLWLRDLRRITCNTDRLTTALAAQLWSESDCEFRTAFPNYDLVFVGTNYQCTGQRNNKVIAVQAHTGNIQWSFNSTGATQVARVTGLSVDTTRNRVYAVTDEDPSPVLGTVFLLDSITGTRLSQRHLGAIDVPAIVGERGLYVLTREGTLYRLDPDSLLATDWSVTLPGAGAPFDRHMAFDPVRNMLFAVGSNSVVYAISDDGASGSNPWGQASTSLPHGLFSRVDYAPFLGKLYVTTDAGKVRQIDGLTGTLESLMDVGLGAGFNVLVDSTVGEGRVESRLTMLTEDWLVRTMIPWDVHSAGACNMDDSPIGPGCDLALQGSTEPATPGVGETVTDTLTVLNKGNRAPRCAMVRAALPSGMSFLGATVSQGTIGLEGGEIVAHLGALPIGQSASIAIDLRLDQAGSFPRTYTASSDHTDPFPADDILLLGN